MMIIYSLFIIIELRWCIAFIADANEEIDDGPIVETVYVTEKGEEYLGQVNYVTPLILLYEYSWLTLECLPQGSVVKRLS